MRSSRGPRTLRLLAFLVATLLLACDSCAACGAPHVAEVTKADGSVHLARAVAPEAWSMAGVGAWLDMGDAIRTGPDSTATLRLDDGSIVELAPSSTLRLLSERPEDPPTLDLVAGEAVVVAEEGLDVGGGGRRARLDPGARVELRSDEGGLEVTLTVGRARLEGDDAAPSELVVGEAVRVAPARPAPMAPTATAAATATAQAPPAIAAAAPTTPAGPTVQAIVEGSPHEARAPGSGEWTDLASGTHALAPGTRLRQSAGGSVELADGARRVTLRGDAELVVGEGERLATIVSGTPEIASSSDGVAIVTAGGVIVTRPEGGRAAGGLERRDDGSLALRVESGAMEVAREGAAAERVEAGATLTLTPAEGDADEALDHADLSLAAGGNVVVRDLHPPTAIGFSFGDACPGDAVLERLAGRGSRVASSGRGRGSVSLGFPAGTHRYQVRCLVDGVPRGRPVARGRVQVLRTSGQAPLPRSAPESTVDADGRSYTVLYQNRLPAITARWPGGHAGPGTLVVRSRSGSRRIAVRGPQHRFAPGELPEGSHTLHFEAASGGRQSRDTTVQVRFDEAAASASLAEPADGSFAAGETVRVSGTALAGWEVRAGGRDVPVANDQRFAGQAVVPASGVLVVELRKPGQGVHYYLRRARGAGGP